LAIAFAIVSASNPAGSAAGDKLQPQGLVEQRFQSVRGERAFLEYAPPSFARGNGVIIILHGGGQGMRRMFASESSANRSWLQIADEEGALLLAPNGTDLASGDPFGDHQSWNDLRNIWGDNPAAPDDVTFIAALIDWAATERGADRSRIYVSGASNGGIMVFRLLLERPSLFAAGAAFIASLPEGELPLPPEARPIILINGTADHVVYWQGGELAGARGRVRSARETLDFWLSANGLEDQDPLVVDHLPDRVDDDGCRVTIESYGAAERPPLVEFVAMVGGGHWIPSTSSRTVSHELVNWLGPRCREVDGPRLAWSFLRLHRRP
jgi:polyhydroxybutyrate depolymerase